MAIEYDLYTIIRDVQVYIEFDLRKIKVLIILLSIVGFSLFKNRRYVKTNDVDINV
jgi:hypothetical protein